MNVYRRVLETTTKLLRDNINVENRTIVFDLDDTIIDTNLRSDHHVPMVGMVEFYDRIPEMVELVKRAKVMGYIIIIITARPPGTEYIAIENLKEKIPEIIPLIDKIYASPIPLSGDIERFKQFKAVLRNKLEQLDLKSVKQLNSWQLYTLELYKQFKQEDRINIVLTIGDQPHDIARMSNYGILLPRRERDPHHAYLYQKTYLKTKNYIPEVCLQKI
jgi:histidinol phosphatase-like enzyme